MTRARRAASFPWRTPTSSPMGTAGPAEPPDSAPTKQLLAHVEKQRGRAAEAELKRLSDALEESDDSDSETESAAPSTPRARPIGDTAKQGQPKIGRRQQKALGIFMGIVRGSAVRFKQVLHTTLIRSPYRAIMLLEALAVNGTDNLLLCQNFLFGLIKEAISERNHILAKRKQTLVMFILKRSSKLVALLLRKILPKFQRTIKHRIEAAILGLHRTNGLPLAEEGILSKYRIEILRLNSTWSQSFRRVSAAQRERKSRAGNHRHSLSHGRGTYKLVRKGNLWEATEPPVRMTNKGYRGIIKFFHLEIVPHITKTRRERKKYVL